MSNIKDLPYEVSNFETLRKKNLYYVDKTPFLKELEDAGRYLFLIRPNGFGKSLFTSMMQCYYDIHCGDRRFKQLFRDTWISDHPTRERGQYLVLSLDFSRLVSPLRDVKVLFTHYLRKKVLQFIDKYRDYLSTNKKLGYYSLRIKRSPHASYILSHLFHLVQGANQPLYLIIDEYDNFTNYLYPVLSENSFRNLIRGSSFFQAFFGVLKTATLNPDSPLKRLFITGSSPITMEDLTGGETIGIRVSLSPAFNQSHGFTQQEVSDLIEYYRSLDLIRNSPDTLLNLLIDWYGNYLFTQNGSIRMVHPSMVLEFFNDYMQTQRIPPYLFDRKVRAITEVPLHLTVINGGKSRAANGSVEQIEEVMETEEVVCNIEDGFSIDKITDRENFISLLFYLGLLTIKNVEGSDMSLMIPNENAKRFFFDYLNEFNALRETLKP
ncbi:MAG: AAA family ATPase [Candidatus Omnitrophota bacterium]